MDMKGREPIKILKDLKGRDHLRKTVLNGRRILTLCAYLRLKLRVSVRR